MPEVVDTLSRNGYCVEGPLNFKRFRTYHTGLVYVDPSPDVNTLWFYDWNGKVFQCRDIAGQPIDTSNPDFQWGVDTTDFEVVLNPAWSPS